MLWVPPSLPFFLFFDPFWSSFLLLSSSLPSPLLAEGNARGTVRRWRGSFSSSDRDCKEGRKQAGSKQEDRGARDGGRGVQEKRPDNRNQTLTTSKQLR